MTKAEHTRLHKRGVPLSEATKKAVSEAHKGVPLSEDHKKAISDALKGILRPYLKGIPRSEATKKAISDALKGVPRSEATKKAIGEARSKKILQLTKSGEFIKEWPSAVEASIRLGIAQPSIWRCCRGTRKSAGGFVWIYATNAKKICD